jgi:hypothetical protein
MKGRSLKSLLAENKRLKEQLNTVLSLRVEIKATMEVFEKISVTQLHCYLREHGWTVYQTNLRTWIAPGEKWPLRTLDRDGYADHPQRMAVMISYCANFENRSPIAVLLDLQATKTNQLDKLVDAISEDE